MSTPAGRPAPDVIVVGGGIVGCAIARLLARRGRRALLLEQASLGGAVSGASLACIGTHMISREEIDILKWSCTAWRDLDEELGGRMEYQRCGQLRFIAREADVAVGRSWVELERASGLRSEVLSPVDLRAIEPALTGPVLAATWSPDDAVVTPFLAVRALVADGLAHGLEVRSRSPVEAVLVDGGRVTGVRCGGGAVSAPVVVLAAGPWTARLARTAGVDLPLRPRKAQCLATVRLPPAIRTVVGACESAGGVAAGYTQIQQAPSGQVLFNTVLAGGLSEPGAEDHVPEVDPTFVRDSIRTLLWLFPGLAGAELLRSWVRYEAVTPDDRFLVGPAGPEGLLIAAGDGGTGFIRAPAIARAIADRLDGREPPFAASLWSPERFAGRAAA